MAKVSKVLVIGSGPIVIGQAAEFDYAGTQACKALREEGVTSVLVNSNPATIMTDEGIADIVYIEPLTVDVISRIIEKERPDGLLPTLGGQTGLNMAVDLADAGVLDKYNVRALGTPIDTIRKAEDRDLFKQMLADIGEPVPESAIATGMKEAQEAVEAIGLPVVIRPAYTLGGTGGGHAATMEQFKTVAANGLAASPARQILIEKSVLGWKEIEYELIRDGNDNCITVCNMENIDPMGVHTGDSIVIAPSQTLTDREHQMLRSASIRIIKALGVEGGCNIQFGLAPHKTLAKHWPPGGSGKELIESLESGLPPYCVIEVNPRVSRSSALASKATGYPIARVSAKIAVGRTLDEIENKVTGKTTAAFEPTLDYVVVKVPRWPFDKFATGDRQIGTQMKATGEVMAIDRTFEAALQKAVRSLEMGGKSLLWEEQDWVKNNVVLWPSDLRLWAIMAALRRGTAPEEISIQTGIDQWFTQKFYSIIKMEKRLLSETLTPQLLREAKRVGFSDVQIATLADRLPEQIRALRRDWGVTPVYKMVDTCAAEFDAETAYFYSTYEQENEAEPIEGNKAVVIGSGPIRIGQGIEFDYSSVHAAWALQEAHYSSIIINSNPETVSTDSDTSNRLYFEAMDEESVRDILENEAIDGEAPPASIVQFGGQTAINLVDPLSRNGMPILGSSPEAIDQAEDRHRFEDLMNRLGIPQPPGGTAKTVEGALNVAKTIGYPVLVRPSYVLGGRAMEIVHNATELIHYMNRAIELGSKHPVLIDKYFEGKEVEVDAICDGERVLIPGIMEHIERAGVHSGDSMAVYPGLNLTKQEISTIIDFTTEIGLTLDVKGLMNIQYVIMPNEDGTSSVYILEVNPRASRTVPFISKVTGVPMVKVATKIMLGQSLKKQGYEGGLWPTQGMVAVKAPVFSMSKLSGVDGYLGPEMKSTGEVMGVDYAFAAAVAKALLAADMMIPSEGALLLSIADQNKPEALPIIRNLSALGFKLYATEGTAALLKAVGIPVIFISKKLSEGYPNIVDIIRDGTLSGIVNTNTGERGTLSDGFDIRRAAVEKRIPCFTSLDTIKAVVDALQSGEQNFSVQPLRNYMTSEVA
ncbi:MAG: carbamoyl-phosphate synthase large subunit [Chloroflexota bacterium]|nr:carbamoyl-phosphate synthase large subunit [Chloroflexota bacterium]